MDKQRTIKDWVTNHTDELTTIIKRSNSYTEILTALGAQVTNTSARKKLKEFIIENQLDSPNYNQFRNSLPVEDRANLTREEVLARLVKSDKYLGTALRKWVLTYKILPYQCMTDGCLLSDPKNLIWNGQEIVLDLDHINGDNTDNRLENLRFLCPNCHSQTETYKGKNKRPIGVAKAGLSNVERVSSYLALPDKDSLMKEINTTGSKNKVAIKYGVTIYAINARLNDRDYSDRNSLKANWATPEELISNISKLGWEATGRQYNVSGNAVRKYLKNRGVDPRTVPTPHKTGPKREA